MTIELAAVKSAFSKIASGDHAVARTAVRIVAKGAFLVAMALMIVTYAVSVSQSAAPAPEPLPPYIYS
jgi:hypothetical protein